MRWFRRRSQVGRRAEPDTLGPGPHNPMHEMFADEIILTDPEPCVLGLPPEVEEHDIYDVAPWGEILCSFNPDISRRVGKSPGLGAPYGKCASLGHDWYEPVGSHGMTERCARCGETR